MVLPMVLRVTHHTTDTTDATTYCHYICLFCLISRRACYDKWVMEGFEARRPGQSALLAL